MATDLGVDIGTSAVKAVLIDEGQRVVAEAAVPLDVSRPQPLWSEQDPDAWWEAVQGAVGTLRRQAPGPFSALRSIGLSGQMHGAVLLDDADRPLRPAILWNDGRSFREAEDLAARHPHLSVVTGVLQMAGLTAPKLPWLARHEPQVLRAARTVLLPKDYIRLRLTGERITDMSDAAGTGWLDQARRTWSSEALEATGMKPNLMPRLVEGSDPAGRLRPEIATAWGVSGPVVVAGGAGDVAAGSIGLGAIRGGDAFLSLGTSGQFFVTSTDYRPAADTLIHAFCHALPRRWFQMAAMLNGASCLAWAARLVGTEVADLLAEAEARFTGPAPLLFLPYLAGERTPHNDPHARGVFFGLSPDVDRAMMAQAVLEGVAFSFADAKGCLEEAGTVVAGAGVVGGGARSRFWTRILANVLDLPLTRYADADKGPAFGAARLGRLALTREDPDDVCSPPPALDLVEPEPDLVARYRPRFDAFRRLYRILRPEFRAG